ncbi:hypothetical protein rpr22_0657 [Rickettsia prowazekii str. Rp22]|uniref:Uncharacterized protein n=1 Tax=Rickettsia prowazekii (strain Rp22) TaxID=449216 RepID=D5AXM7_RICPP|nr:hypothetical protein rpr22_0657 [Rickettsia prowazekii str. Rp22]
MMLERIQFANIYAFVVKNNLTEYFSLLKSKSANILCSFYILLNPVLSYIVIS